MPILLIHERTEATLDFVANSKTIEVSRVFVDSFFYFHVQSVASHFYSDVITNGQIFDLLFEFFNIEVKWKTMFNFFSHFVSVSVFAVRIFFFQFFLRQKNGTIQIFFFILRERPDCLVFYGSLCSNFFSSLSIAFTKKTPTKNLFVSFFFLLFFIAAAPQRPKIEHEGIQVPPGHNVTVDSKAVATVTCVSHYGNPAATLKWFLGK